MPSFSVYLALSSICFAALITDSILVKPTRPCPVLVANRVTEDIEDVLEKVYSRDLFGAD